MALMSAMMFGSLSMAARAWDGGEAKAADVSSMRQAQEFLREQLEAEHAAARQERSPSCRCCSTGRATKSAMRRRCRRACRTGAPTSFGSPSCKNGDKSQLVLERTIPDPAATQNPEFGADAEHSVLADDIAELHVSYFGRDPNAADRRQSDAGATAGTTSNVCRS